MLHLSIVLECNALPHAAVVVVSTTTTTITHYQPTTTTIEGGRGTRAPEGGDRRCSNRRRERLWSTRGDESHSRVTGGPSPSRLLLSHEDISVLTLMGSNNELDNSKRHNKSIVGRDHTVSGARSL
jgi:hypothetical protein